MVLVWIIAGMIAAGIAGFAVTTLTGGKTPTPSQSPAGLTSSAAASSTSGAPRRVWLRVLLGCRPERVRLGERRSVIGPGHVSAGQRAGIRTRGYLPVGERIRVREPPRVRLAVADPGLVYIRGPEADADADRISTDIDAADHARDYGTHNYGTRNYGAARIHVGEHRNIRIATRVRVAGTGENGRYVALGARRRSLIRAEPARRSPGTRSCWRTAARRLPAAAAGVLSALLGDLIRPQARYWRAYAGCAT